MSGPDGDVARATRSMMALAVVGQAILFALTAVLANTMSPPAFEAYAAAASLFLLATRLAPLGVESLALRVMAPAHRDGDGRTLRAFLRYAAVRGAIGCVAVMALAVAAFKVGAPGEGLEAALLMGWLAIPLGVAAHIGFDVMIAVGRARAAAAQLRMVVPGLALACILVMMAANVDITGARAIGAWTLAWAVVVPLQWHVLIGVLPRGNNSGATRTERSLWTRLSVPLFLYQLGTGVLVQAPVLALVTFDVPAATIGAYVAASTCASLLLVVGAAANRVYARELAVLVDRGDVEGARLLKRRRIKRMAPGLAVALGLCLVVPEWMLTWFGEAFAREGTWILRILAVAAVVTLVFALAPTYVTYAGRGGWVTAATLAAATFEVVLLVLLVPPIGAIGAALCYAVGIIAFYAAVATLAARAAQIGRR